MGLLRVLYGGVSHDPQLLILIILWTVSRGMPEWHLVATVWDACKSYDDRVSWYYSPQTSISSLTFGLRPAAGVLCSGDRSRMRRAARARPPAEAAPKPCYATPSRSLHLFACIPYRVLIIALNLFHSSTDRFRRPFIVLNFSCGDRERSRVYRASIGWHQLSQHVRWKQYALSVHAVAVSDARGPSWRTDGARRARL